MVVPQRSEGALGGMSPPAWLEPIAGPPIEPTPAPPDGGALLLGRGDDCGVVLAHESVSRHHCRIAGRAVAGRLEWSIVDLASTHGTIVDGAALAPEEPRALRHGCVIAIGPWLLRLRVGESDAPVGVAAPSRRFDQSLATRPTIFIRLQASDPHERELSWQEFRDRYAPVIVGFARRAGLASGDAEDVLQDVLLAFFRVSPRFQYDPEKGRFRGYLKRATLNVIRRRGRHAAPSPLQFDVADEHSADAERQLDDRWEEQWQAQVLERALNEVRAQLDPRTWEAFELSARAGVPVAEVAARLGLAPNSVHQAKSRVLKAARAVVARIRGAEG